MRVSRNNAKGRHQSTHNRIEGVFGGMRALHILRKFDPREWGGTETAVEALLEGLVHNGVDAWVFAPRAAGLGPESDTLGPTGHAVQRYRAFLPVAGLSQDARENLIAVGGNLMSFDLLPMLLRARGSIIHSHALGRIGAIARAAARVRNLPFVVTIHGGYRDLPESVRAHLTAPLARGVEYGKAFGLLLGARKVVTGADAVLTNNAREAELLADVMPSSRIHQIPHGVPLALFREDHRAAGRALIPELDGRPYLLCLARLDTVKNQGFLIDQMPRIRARFPEAALVMVGAATDEVHEAYVAKRTKELGLEPHVKNLGPLPLRDPRLIGLLQDASAMVLPSLAETFGLVFLEALASGTPVIATRTSGAMAIVSDGVDGELFDIGDESQYEDAVSRILGDRARARAMGARGTEKVASKYDQAVIAKQIFDLYRELGQQRRRRR